MTKESQVSDLLKKRFKVIADWPGCPYIVGGIIGKWGMQADMMKPEYYQKYPHLFKELAWWEERDWNNMPQYVKRESGVVVKIDLEYMPRRCLTDGFVYLCDRDEANQKNFIWLKHTTPATEQDYLNYKQHQP